MDIEKRLTDVIVIGAGVVGLATAWNYKKQAPGSTVRIVDRVSSEASPLQASAVNCGILCHESAYAAPAEKLMLKVT